MKVVHKNHLGINLATGTVHVDDWSGYSGGKEFKILCCGNLIPYEYTLLANNNINQCKTLCKTCTKLALRKKRCLVSAVALLKLKRDLIMDG